MLRDKVKGENLRSDKIAERKITRETMVETVVLVRNLFAACFAVVEAFSPGLLVRKMFNRMNGLKQYREQYRCNQRKIKYGKSFFHPTQM